MLANSADPDQTAHKGAFLSGSVLYLSGSVLYSILSGSFGNTMHPLYSSHPWESIKVAVVGR